MIERILDRLDAQDERSSEFREEVLNRLGAIETRIAILETKQSGAKSGVKLVGWLLVFAVNIGSVFVTYLIAK